MENNPGSYYPQGSETRNQPVQETYNRPNPPAPVENKKIIAGIMAILFGAFGVHKFILGYTKEGLIMLGVTIFGWITSFIIIGLAFVWIPGVIGLVEGIIYLSKSDQEFYQTYQVGKRPWF